MEQIRRYEVIYSNEAIGDIENKADYIAAKFRDPALAEEWYLRLRADIQDQLTTFPSKFHPYTGLPEDGQPIRLYVTRNDIVAYSVDEDAGKVHILAVCTKGRNLMEHLSKQK